MRTSSCCQFWQHETRCVEHAGRARTSARTKRQFAECVLNTPRLGGCVGAVSQLVFSSVRMACSGAVAGP
eukprot:365636-Chlamydomonas_euryale.AAC.17